MMTKGFLYLTSPFAGLFSIGKTEGVGVRGDKAKEETAATGTEDGTDKENEETAAEGTGDGADRVDRDTNKEQEGIFEKGPGANCG